MVGLSYYAKTQQDAGARDLTLLIVMTHSRMTDNNFLPRSLALLRRGTGGGLCFDTAADVPPFTSQPRPLTPVSGRVTTAALPRRRRRCLSARTQAVMSPAA